MRFVHRVAWLIHASHARPAYGMRHGAAPNVRFVET
jgi:hypothetical protein